MSPLINLAERCEKASGPDRELDVLIWAELDGRDVRRDGDRLLARSRKPPHDECLLGSFTNPDNFLTPQYGYVHPRLTASIDAAVALCERVLPEGAQWTVSNSRGINDYTAAALIWVPKKTFEICGYAKSPALALCAATLRALDAKEKP